MSFSSEIKEDLAAVRPRRQCCKVGELSGMLQLAGSVQLGAGGIKARLVSENYAVTRRALALAKGLFNLESEMRVRERSALGRTRSFEILFGGESVRPLLLRTGLLKKDAEGSELTCGIPEELRENACCKRAFLRGAFLGGGSASDPARGYHLEWIAQSEQLCGELCALLNEYGLGAKTVLRKGAYVVYLKDSGKISDFFSLIGAGGATLGVQSARIYKDFRNNLNRALNCEMANLDKTLSASARQLEGIRRLRSSGRLGNLAPGLRQVAEIRLRYPEASLQELGEMLDPPLGRSGVNHRLRKLESLSGPTGANTEG